MPTTAKPRRYLGETRIRRKTVEEHKEDGTFRADRHTSPPPKIDTKPRIRLPSLKATKPWIRSEADERAIANGCRFSERLAEFVVGWIKKYLRHSEGRWAGEPFELMDWQRDELFYPLFGWVRRSPETDKIIRRYRRVYVEIPKKNGKSPTAAVIGTYMLAGDGEPGAKVFSVATTKEQARIVHDHAIHMVEDAPDLLANSKINRTTQHILFKPTRSTYVVISSMFRGAEGLNGNCAILDELHAWRGDQLYRALKPMFASRLEPILFQITTAGTDMQSVCRQQHEYARGVVSGDIWDDGFLPLIYAADKEDDWRAEETWTKANPSIGVTVLRSDLHETFNEEKTTAAGQASFKRYRLNIWATAENPWLNMDAWARCESPFTEESLEGRPCWAGLDLSKSGDMTALALCFPPDPDGEDVYQQLVYFWLPEDTVKSRRHLAAYEDWVRRGHIGLMPGGECDYEFVIERIVELKTRFKLRELLYDEMFARPVCQELEEKHGIKRRAFPQTIVAYSHPTTEYERLVNQGRLRHNGNPVLTWQAGHVKVKMDANRNIRPLKQTRGDYRSVDGIVAGIMALAGALDGMSQPENVYLKRGFRRL